MRNYLPSQQGTPYLQINRGDELGNVWSSFGLDFQSKLNTLRLAQKLVTNTTSSDDADLGLPTAFEYWYNQWWAICGTRIFKSSSGELTSAFSEETAVGYTIGLATTQFDITRPGGNTSRYTYDGTGIDPAITATSIPIGATVIIAAENFLAGNNGTFTVTASGTNYFEISNAGGSAESNKTIGTGSITVTGGTYGTSFVSTGSDLSVAFDKLFATNNTRLYYRNANTNSDPWILVDTFSSQYVPHKTLYFKKFDRFYYIASSISIRSLDSSLAVATSGSYTLDTGLSVGWLSGIVANSSYIWVYSLTDNSSSDNDSNKINGFISQWDGFSSQVSNEYPINAGGVLAMCVLNDVPYAIDTEGRILKYSGYSFDEIARLPIDRTLLANSTIATANRWVHFNGFVGTKNNTLLVMLNNLNGDNAGTITENMPSGIWELDLETRNFTHKYPITLKARSSSTITDYGQNRISAAGAIKINHLQSSSANGRSTIVAGATYYTDASTTKSGIFIDSPSNATTDNEGQKRGYIVTTWSRAQDINETWQNTYITYRKFLSASDKIICKYRTTRSDPTEISITWVDTTHFTTSTDVSGKEGYEVEGIQGTGSGDCAHISSISVNAGTYTVTLESAFTGVTTGTAKVRLQNWIKMGEVTDTGEFQKLAIETISPRIQLKLYFEFTGNGEFHQSALISKPHQLSN